MTITILGLGPGEPFHLTRQAWDVLSQADEVYLRTRRHPAVTGLPAHVVVYSFDHVYDTLDSFADVYETIAAEILDLGRRSKGVLYAVPGHPLVGESSVLRLLARARQERLAVRIVEGLSFVEPVLSLLEIDGLAGLQLVDATDLAVAHHPPLDPDRPSLIGQLSGVRLASEVKLTLMNGYPDHHPVTLVQAAGTNEEIKEAERRVKAGGRTPGEPAASRHEPAGAHGRRALSDSLRRRELDLHGLRGRSSARGAAVSSREW